MQTDDTGREWAIGRRAFVAFGAATVALAAKPGLAAALSNVIDVTVPPYNASPNLPDNTSNFQLALNNLAALGGGVLIVPPGYYALQGGLTYAAANGSLTIMGHGSELSVLMIRHSSTALDVAFGNKGDSQSLVVKDIGFSPAPASGHAGTAIALSLPNVESAWPSCHIENVDFGTQSPGYTVFTTALNLANVWRSSIVNCTAHGNGQMGGIFLALQGRCIDNRVDRCNIDSYEYGIAVGSYSEGLHITNTVFIGGTAVWTGKSAYNGAINLLGLFISGCELNCTNTVLSLYQVNQGWISETDLNGPHPSGGSVGCVLTGCTRLKFSERHFLGCLNVQSPTMQIGISAASSAATSTCAISVDNCEFENTLVGILLGANTTNFTGLGVRMLAPGNAALVSTPQTYGNLMQQPLVDNSGNTTNLVQWLGTVNVPVRDVSQRTIYSR